MNATEQTAPERPTGDLTVKVVAMPADTNANGDIFGGWVSRKWTWRAASRGSSRRGGAS